MIAARRDYQTPDPMGLVSCHYGKRSRVDGRVSRARVAFSGFRHSALDLYIAVMTRWRPGRKWFTANTPKVISIAEKTAATPQVAAVIAKNF